MNRARTHLTSLTVALVTSGLLVGVGACRRSGAPVGAMEKKAGEKVAKIVFVGKKNACDCTARRVEGTWDALHFALKGHKGLKVKRVAVDVHEKEVGSLRAKRRFMVLPALYFFNPEGKLVGVLEGELRPEKISQMLQ